MLPLWFWQPFRPEYVSASDAGKGQDAGANWMSARGYVLEDTGAEINLGTCLLLTPPPDWLEWPGAGYPRRDINN